MDLEQQVAQLNRARLAHRERTQVIAALRSALADLGVATVGRTEFDFFVAPRQNLWAHVRVVRLAENDVTLKLNSKRIRPTPREREALGLERGAKRSGGTTCWAVDPRWFHDAGLARHVAGLITFRMMMPHAPFGRAW